MKATRLLFFIMTFCLGVGTQTFADSGQGTSGSATLSSKNGISGSVKEAQSGNAIAGASVIITAAGGQTYQTTTLTDGTFFYSMMPTGSFNISVSKQGYQSANQTVNTNSGCYVKVFSLVQSGATFISLTDELGIYASSIVENPTGFYTLNGDVNINGILYFTGQVKVDKRPSLYYPEISGNCGFYAADIQGTNRTFKDGNVAFNYYADGNTLNPKSFAHILNGVMFIGGFNVKLGQFIIAEDGSEVEVKVIAKMPFPVDKIMEFIEENAATPFGFIQEASFSDIYNKTEGHHAAGSISDLSINFGIFAIENGSLYFNQSTEVFGGGFSIRIPGRIASKDTAFLESGILDSLQNLAVVIQTEEGDPMDTTNLGELIQMKQFFDPEFFKAGVEIEFVSGEINKLILSLGVKIPIDATGLFITELTGGVENMVNKDDWRIIASIDVETGLEIPLLGSPIKLNDFGVNIHPMSYLKGSGSFEVFGHEVSDGYMEYDGRKRSLTGEARLDIADMIIGRSYLNVRKSEFSGGGEFTMKTPSQLPWILNWAENKVLTSAAASIYNFDIKTQTRYMGLSLAQRFEFGKQGFPWFHYYIGTDYNHLVQIWKGLKAGKSAIQFQVPDNCPQFFLVAGDTMNFNEVNFQIQSPDGKTYDSTFAQYYHFDDSHQTLIVIDKPVPGEWTFFTSDTANLRMESMFQNQQPTGLIEQPLKKGTKTNTITLNFSDYADTLLVKVFYDTDKAHFDGSFIQEFSVVNNTNLTFEWLNDSIPDGEYYIYCMIDDGKNAPVMQYAPGSILVDHHGFTDVPQNVVVSQVGDSLRVQWDTCTGLDVRFTTVYFENLSTRRSDQVTVIDTNVAYFTDLEPGRAYRVWCRFVNEARVYGPESGDQEIIFHDTAGVNQRPYFTTNPKIPWKLIAGESSSFGLAAGDADGDNLTFALPGDTLGMIMNDTMITWTPTYDQRGVYRLMATVTDGEDTDTTYIEVIVYTQEQVDVSLGFSSVNLYENDNKFVKIRNYRSSAQSIWVSIKNMVSGDSIDVSCRKVDEFEYIGKFDLSYVQKSALPVSNGDSILLSYYWQGQAYTAIARYDSLSQPSDEIPPAVITDLQVHPMTDNLVKLFWTATGNDGATGLAYKYDIRYAFVPITDEGQYLVANRIFKYPYPASSGSIDSLMISLDTLQGVMNADTVWFAIKAEDEMQNRSTVSNSPYSPLELAIRNVEASVSNIYNIELQWQGTNTHTSFQHYALYRSAGSSAYSLLTDTLTQNSFIDNLYTEPDADYSYALQVVYATGISDTVFSEPVSMHRFNDVAVLCQLEDTTVYDSVYFSLTGLDTVYQQQFDRITNPTGLALMGDVFYGDYLVNITKTGFVAIHDTICINPDSTEFVFTLMDAGKPRMISGNLSYKNNNATPMGNVVVKLIGQGEIALDSITTDPVGGFIFYAEPGEYNLHIECSKTHGGVNSVDALAVLRHTVEVQLLEGLNYKTADVNGSNNVNSIDGLLILRRYTELITSFVIGDWVYDTETITVQPGTPLVLDIKVLCSGDVNGSYIPPGN